MCYKSFSVASIISCNLSLLNVFLMGHLALKLPPFHWKKFLVTGFFFFSFNREHYMGGITKSRLKKKNPIMEFLRTTAVLPNINAK